MILLYQFREDPRIKDLRRDDFSGESRLRPVVNARQLAIEIERASHFDNGRRWCRSPRKRDPTHFTLDFNVLAGKP